MLEATTIKFLRDLNKNNNKPWFDEHRPQYELARKDFENFIETVIKGFAQKEEDLQALKAKDCIFRINRDVRFAKDKSPYKNNMGASMNRGGKKSIFAGYYFHCQPGESFAGGGLWMPMAAETKKIRQEIDYCYDEFRTIVQSKKFIAVYGSLETGNDYSLVNVPKGYEKDNPAAAYIKLKSWIATRAITDAELNSGDLVKKVIASFESLQPLVKFINRAIE